MPELELTGRSPLSDTIASMVSQSSVVSPYDDGRAVTPGTPIPAIEPEGEQPRSFPIQAGQNLILRPRGDSAAGQQLTAFDLLLNLADFDLVRVAIEDVKRQVRGMDWDVVARPEFEDAGETLQATVDRARAWIERPDPLAALDFDDWLGSVLEEILVTDALTLLPRRTVGGEWIGLQQVDGTSIKPLVDVLGRPPLPPAPAYQQIIYGRPETQFGLDELWYLPSSRRPRSPYGRSSVENVLLTVNVALRYELYDLAFFTSGNLPDSLYALPQDKWTPAQIAEWQKNWDAILEGRIDRRSGGMRFVPEGTYYPTKDRPWSYEFMEWLGRVIAWAFGVSPIPIARVMNRATGEELEASSLEAGPRPVAQFVAKVINRGIREGLGIREVEFRWADDETEDPATVYQRTIAYAHGGLATLNEQRKKLGEEPYPEEFGKRPFIVTGSGIQWLDEAAKPKQPVPPALQGGPGGGQMAPPGSAGEQPAAEQAPEPDEPPIAALARAELHQWRRKVLDRLAKGRPLPKFDGRHISPAARARIEKALGMVA